MHIADLICLIGALAGLLGLVAAGIREALNQVPTTWFGRNMPRISVLLLGIGGIGYLSRDWLRWDGVFAKKRSPMEEQAIKAAVEHLKADGGLSPRYEVHVTTHDDGTRWVHFNFLPATPGAFCDVVIDKTGKVLRVIGGE